MEVELIVLYLEISNPVSIIIKREVKDNCHVSGMGICVKGEHILLAILKDRVEENLKGHIQTMKHQIINAKEKCYKHIAGPKFCNY